MFHSTIFFIKIIPLAIAPFSFISVGIPCEFAMVPDVYIYCPILLSSMHI